MGTFFDKETELQYRVEVLERQVADLQRALANAKTGERQLTIPAVSGAKRKVCPVCKKAFEKGWGEFCSQDCWDTDM